MPFLAKRIQKNTELEQLKEPQKPPRQGVLRRLSRALGPIIPALILDSADFLTAGPLGLYLGAIIGFPMGYWICSKYKLPFLKRILGAFAAGIYCSLPFTEFAPAALLIGIYARFHHRPEG